MSKKSGKAKTTIVEENAVTRQMVVSNYGKLCKSTGVPMNSHVNDVLKGNSEEEADLVNFILEGEIGQLGPGGVRAFVMALQGIGPGIVSGPYVHLRYIRIWNQDVGNEGAAVIATLLQSTAPSTNIAYLELLDCGIGSDGCIAIANAIKAQKQPGLLTLNLDYNSDISDDGVSALCDALFTNTVLKKLHLDYCNLGPKGSIKLGQLVAMPRSALESLSLQARSQHLVTLNLADNAVRHNEEALTAFQDALVRSKVLAHVDFTYNQIEPEGGVILLQALTPENTKIQSFQVDASLPAALFTQLNRAPKGDGKKGKKKGKKKK